MQLVTVEYEHIEKFGSWFFIWQSYYNFKILEWSMLDIVFQKVIVRMFLGLDQNYLTT